MARVLKSQTAKGTTTYLVKWRTPDGKDRTKRGFRTKKLAEAYAIKQAEAKLRGADYDPAAGGITFREAAAEWLVSRHDLKPTTHASYAEALAPTTPATLTRHKRLAGLRIDAVFGGYPLRSITRVYIQAWVNKLSAAGKQPSTVRNSYRLVRMVLAQAVADGALPNNPADYVKLPTEHSTGGGSPAGVVDDPAQFLTAAQVTALVEATPWPYNILVHLAAWSGLRAAELAGLQVGDIALPERAGFGALRVERTVQVLGGQLHYGTPKTRGSRRRVPLTGPTTAILRDYLTVHPRADDPTAPLFPAVGLVAQRSTGVRAGPVAATESSDPPAPVTSVAKAHRQASALADLSVTEAEARITVDWNAPLRHATLYKSIYRPSVMRANRLMPTAKIAPGFKFHSLRHTYISLCVAAGLKPLEISRFAGHAKPSTTLGIYAHLFEDHHDEAMAALGAMVTGVRPVAGGNVIPMRR